jgi:hypothetical protein
MTHHFLAAIKRIFLAFNIVSTQLKSCKKTQKEKARANFFLK